MIKEILYIHIIVDDTFSLRQSIGNFNIKGMRCDQNVVFNCWSVKPYGEVSKILYVIKSLFLIVAEKTIISDGISWDSMVKSIYIYIF